MKICDFRFWDSIKLSKASVFNAFSFCPRFYVFEWKNALKPAFFGRDLSPLCKKTTVLSEKNDDFALLSFIKYNGL